ncbi:TPA: endonuclease [Candidatus Acetothermia bacterium]|nr:endonuclease [Candidatus Acetothermia bacterium]
MLLGCHLSIGKGFAGAIEAAENLGINALQIFSHNASSWKMKTITRDAASSFQTRFKNSSVEVVVIHTMYLLNPASPDEVLFERSVAALEQEVKRAGILGIDRIVTHLGAHKGSGIEAGIARIVAALDRVIASETFSSYKGVEILLENTAGTGTTMGASFSELGAIISALSDASRVGICLDTCHAFAAGYELRTFEGLAETLEALDREVGLGRLKVIHLNDSKYPLGSRRDRHAHIGYGEIGMEGFSLIVNHKALHDLPFILETPKQFDGQADADRINLDLVRSLRRE